MINKDKMPVTIGVAFVWFTTQFGGGFASGAQLKVYFLKYGLWCFLTPVIAQAIAAVYQWYALRYAYNHKKYDYRSFNDSFYGKLSPIFSNLYELLFFVLLCLAPAVAFATGGATMNQLLGIPYLLCTAIIGIFIFIVAVYGTDIVRKVASTLSILIIAGLLLIFVPNIIAQWSTISTNIGGMRETTAPFGSALWKGFVYAAFQLAAIGLYAQHAKPFTSPDDSKTSMIYGFITNSVLVLISIFGLLVVVNMPEYAEASVPVLILVQNGIGSSLLTPIISILIILGAVSTAVNMIAGVSMRVCAKVEKNDHPGLTENGKPSKTAIITTAFFTLLAFSVAQFGLLPLIGRGYSYLGYLTIPIIMIPFVIHMIVTRFDTKEAGTIGKAMELEPSV